MRYVNELADQCNVPCYLETTGAKNISIYKRYGYEVDAEYELTHSPKDTLPVENKERYGTLKIVSMVRPRKNESDTASAGEIEKITGRKPSVLVTGDKKTSAKVEPAPANGEPKAEANGDAK